MKTKEYVNEEGHCPKCDSTDLNYGAVEFEGDMCYFPYTCNECGTHGEEWYRLDFEGHNVYEEDGNVIEL